MKSNLVVRAVIAVAVGFALPAAAQTNRPGAESMRPSASVPYLIGGVGLDERATIEGRAGRFNLRLMFSEADGAYVVPDTVVVKRGAAQVLSLNGGGPLIYMSLPPGVYSVQASYNGVSRTKNVQVSAHTPNVILSWPIARFEPAAD